MASVDTRAPRSAGTLPPRPQGARQLTLVGLQVELQRELARADRRPQAPQLGLIQLHLQQDDAAMAPESGWLPAISQYLRISDSAAQENSRIVVLLPETDAAGTAEVAGRLALACQNSGWSVDVEYAVYPEDDPLQALAKDPPEQTDGQTPDSPAELQDPVSHRVDAPHPVGIRRTDHAFVTVLPVPWWKRFGDMLGASLGLLLLSPVLLVAAAAIKLTSPGPILFRQWREGRNGRQFQMLKFRTMVCGAEAQQAALRARNEQDGPAFKIVDDPRLTSVGRFLRKSCIDELPQLINVLKGEMSLVGPRPLPVNESYACRPWQRRRLTVTPGLTCFWQIRTDRDVTFDQWMRMDLEYIRRRSLRVDAELLLRTAGLVLLHRGSG